MDFYEYQLRLCIVCCFFPVLYVWRVLGLNESELVYYFILFFCTSKAGWAVKWVKSVHGKVESMVFQREYG